MKPSRQISSRRVSRYRRLLSTAVLATTGITTTVAWSYDGAVAGEFSVHHVRLEGTGMAKANRMFFDYVDQACRREGRPPESIPAGENILQIVKDVYYAKGGVTTYTTMKQYSVHPTACRLERTERLEIEMRTAAGVCTITPKRKRAVGYCDVRPLIAGKSIRVVDSQSIKPTGETNTIAGLKCDVFAGSYRGLSTEYCVARAGAFVGAPEGMQFSTPGILLKRRIWASAHPEQDISDMEATSVVLDTEVKLEVLAPHTAGSYDVLPMGSGK